MAIGIETLCFRGVNCYLVTVGRAVFVLVDSGLASQRTKIDRALQAAGCEHGNLKLIVATHADADHIGNCAFLRQKYGARIALHADELEAAQTGDPVRNKNIPRSVKGRLTRLILRRFRLATADCFVPDLTLGDGDDFRAYGFEASTLHLPGHSNGSIGILTEGGDLFCGDLLRNERQPSPGRGIFDQEEFEAGLAKLRQLQVATIYPGHGKPFTMQALANKLGQP